MGLPGDLENLEERLLAGGSITGILQGKFKNKRLEAEWANYNNSLGSRLEADVGQCPNLHI